MPENNWEVIKNEYNLEERNVKEQDYEIDRIISSRSDIRDTERIKTLKKLKLEKILYKNFRNAFKIYINDPMNEYKLKILREVLYSNHDGEKIMNFFEKYEKIEDIVDNFIKENVNWTIGGYNKYYELMDQLERSKFDIDNLILEDDEGKIYMNKRNFITNENNEALYKNKLLNELIKYKTIQKYLLSKNILINFDKVDYKLSKQEILLLES